MNAKCFCRFFIVVAFAGFFGTPVVAQQQDSLTLEIVLQKALSRNNAIIQSSRILDAAHAHVQGLKSSYYPSVNAEASYATFYPNDPIPFPMLVQNPATGALFTHVFNISFAPDNMYDAHIGLDYIIYDFGKRASTVNAGVISENIASDKKQSIVTALSYQVAMLFYGLIYEFQSLKVMDDAIASLDRHLEIVKKRVEAGTATEYDILKTEAQKATTLSQRIDLESDYAKKQTILKQLIGENRSHVICLKGAFDTTKINTNPDSLIKNALDNRSDRALALRMKESAHAQYEIARKENMPVIGCHATAGFKDGIFPNIDDTRFNTTIGVQASIPIYDGKRASSHIAEAKQNEEAAMAGLADLEERIASEVAQATTEVDAAYAKIGVSTTKVTFADKTLALAKMQYESGVITNNDVLDAENDFEQAKLGLLQNQYGYVVNHYMLDQATGMSLIDSSKK